MLKYSRLAGPRYRSNRNIFTETERLRFHQSTEERSDKQHLSVTEMNRTQSRITSLELTNICMREIELYFLCVV